MGEGREVRDKGILCATLKAVWFKKGEPISHPWVRSCESTKVIECVGN